MCAQGYCQILGQIYFFPFGSMYTNDNYTGPQSLCRVLVRAESVSASNKLTVAQLEEQLHSEIYLYSEQLSQTASPRASQEKPGGSHRNSTYEDLDTLAL